MTFEEIMDFNKPYNQKNFDDLVEGIKCKRVVPYIGAGMSMLFEDIYPLWGVFLNNTRNVFLGDEEKIVFDKIDDYEEQADFLFKEIGQRSFSKHLKMIFGQDKLDLRDENDFIDKSVYLIPMIFDSGLIITTNYDKVLEKIYVLHNKTLTVSHPGHFEALNNALRNGELVLYKIHGDITESITSIVLTKEQYETVYSNIELKKMLTQVYTSKEILFLGCSLQKDRPLELLCKVSEAGMGHYAIIPVSNEKKKTRRVDLENEYYTQSIMYPEGKHEAVRIILEHIAELVVPEAYQKLKKASLDGNSAKSLSNQLTEEWFHKQNDMQIKNLGDRYLPELNVELSLEHIFNSLGKNKEYKYRFKEKTDKVLVCIKQQNIEELLEYITDIEEIIDSFLVKTNEVLDVSILNNNFEKIIQLLDFKIDVYKNGLAEGKYKNDKEIDDELYKLYQVQKSIHQYIDYIQSTEIDILNNPYMLLHSDGGMGKSHIIAHTVEKRNMYNQKSLLLLGQHFKLDKNPRKQILEILALDCEFEELLQTLNDIGEKEQQRVILFIDALNEGQGKEIWKYYLSGIVEEIKKYPWLGLVASIRSEYIPSLMDNNSKLDESLVFVEHKGFSNTEYKAMRKYFDVYGIHYSDIPMPNQEFRNPLFLRLMCETFRGNEIDLDTISFTDIYKNYLKIINLRISESCTYSRHINAVTEILNEMVKYKYESGQGNNLIPLSDGIKIMIDIAKKYSIDNIIIDELLASGVINKTVNSLDEEYINVTYEKLEDYIYANLLVKELKEIGIMEFSEKYKKLLSYEDILEVLSIILSEETDIAIPNEIFDIFKNNEKSTSIIRAFINALKWRKTSTITDKTLDYINNVILNNSGYEVNFYNILILISTKTKHRLNANFIVNHILQKNMADRDSRFIPIFNDIYAEEESSINRLLGWCFDKEVCTNAHSETISLAAKMIAIFLISSNRKLRDESTKALISILTSNIDILISVLETYDNVDDPYIMERLYAVAFGCIVSEQSEDMVEKLVVYVYNKIFDVDYVYPNILLRDYAKNIIDYGKYKVNSEILVDMNVEPPYKSNFPEVPGDEVIEEYEYDYESPDFKDYYWSQNAILNSMQVEYSRDGQPGGYGDFGRYTFQSYFARYKGIDYNDLKNIAIKKVFDMGYDVEKHGRFDRKVPSGRSTDKIYERIGKKYQWIALYELAAQVADNYKIEVHTDCYGSKQECYCKGTFEPNIRDIDPTTLPILNNNENKVIHNRLFQFTSKPNNKWLEDFSDFPNINDMVNMSYKNQEFILLNGWYIWSEEDNSKNEIYKNPKKDMWVLINSYIVKTEQLEAVVTDLTGKDFIGRWLAEPNDNYILYNKEYYWSEGYKFFKNPYYCGEEYTLIDKYDNKLDKNHKVLLPTSKYSSEWQGDRVQESDFNSWHKPCSDLFYGMRLKYGNGNSILYNDNDEIICFESSELINENIGFFIKKENFLRYLKEQGYSVFWTMLAEKRIIDTTYNYSQYKTPTISGVYTLDGEGILEGDTVKNE